MKLPGVLRAALLCGLLLALLVGIPERAAERQPVLRLPAAWHRADAGAEQLRAAWQRTVTGAPLLAVRASAEPPDAVELGALAALARGVTVLAVRPRADRVRVRAAAPWNARVGRSTAVPVEVAGARGDSVTLFLHDRGGAVDSMRLTVDAHGRAAGAFAIRPAREGWHEWRVQAGEGSTTVGAWVRATPPPRVLVAAGPPDWESRFVLRALDEAGVEALAVLPLGRGLHAGLAGAALPASDAALAEFDAVIVLAGAAIDATQQRALERFAAAGGGVLAAAQPGLWRGFGIAAEGAATTTVDAAAVRWAVPAGLEPLPAPELRGDAMLIDAPLRLTYTAAQLANGGALLVMRPYGYGRTAALGLTETWRWRMEAGAIDEHRAFWHGLADWLAEDAGTRPGIRLERTRGLVAEPVGLHADDGAGALRLQRPDGSVETLSAGFADEDGVRAAFLAATPGEHRVLVGDGDVRAAYVAGVEAEPSADAAAELALLAFGSGGALVRADSVAAWRDAWLTAAGLDPPPAAWPRWLLFALIAAAAMAEWSVRRLRGMP